MISKAMFFQDPIERQPFGMLPLGAVQPGGWLLDQLRVQAKGLSGHLFELWPDDVGENCAWLGGSGDGWERAPYYLDGLIPLARLLRSRRLIALADRYVEAMLASQREDGSFGPDNADWWPRMIACKALLQQYGATGDRRIPRFLLRYMAHQYRTLDEQPLAEWAVPRACEGALCALQLHGLTGKPFLLRLAERLLAMGTDWTRLFHAFPYGRDLKKTLPWATLRAMREHPDGAEAAQYAFASYHQTHVVNVAMGLKMPAVAHALGGGLKESQAAELGWRRLMKAHGVAGGIFTGDEHLSGSAPTQGTETCAVVEAMFSFEQLLSLSGEPVWGDRLEKLAFGALPAAFTADMWGHQYDQQANQISISDAPRNWYNNGDDANMFGFEPNFGCCTANYHQGWPKFAASLWMEGRDGGLAAQSYAPCTVRRRAGGEPVELEVSGGYPFFGDVRIDVRRGGGTFPLMLRIPAWADGAHCLVNGGTADRPTPGEYLTIEREWRAGDRVELRLPLEPRVTRWSHQSAAVERGPVLYALRVGEAWSRARERENCPECPDRSVMPTTPWNYALLADMPIELDDPGEAAPFGCGRPPVLRASAAPLPRWTEKGNVAAQTPVLPTVDAANVVPVELIPYGGTAMRITQFPVAQVAAETPKEP